MGATLGLCGYPNFYESRYACTCMFDCLAVQDLQTSYAWTCVFGCMLYDYLVPVRLKSFACLMSVEHVSVA
jgi:hypothetical protein